MRADTPSIIQSVLKCIEKCLDSHVHCPKPNPDGPLPTRLVDVGQLNGSSLPRLCSGDECRCFGGRYLALSYCWGDVLPLRTLQSNIEQMMEGIKWDILPLTFQDAICLTRKLGIRHIWIDALCIIQDDKVDWEREASTMGAVYSQAICTIVAHASSSCHDGIIKTRDPLITTPPTLRLSHRRRRSVSVTFYPKIPSLNTLEGESPHAARGWTLQERELSSRVLYFTSHQVIWQCYSTGWSENACNTNHEGIVLDNGLAKKPLFGEVMPQQDIKHVHDLYQTWYSIANDFSTRMLSLSTDKLVAISGMARRMQQKSRDTYVAGLWKNDLLFGLLWSVHPIKPEYAACKRTAEYVAPSWSWASTERGSLWFLGRAGRAVLPTGWSASKDITAHVQHVPKVIDVGVYPSGSDPFGQLKGGFITIHGRVKRGRCLRHTTYPIFCDPDDLPVGQPSSDPSIFDVFFDDHTDYVTLTDVYCLCFYETGGMTGGLALSKVEESNVYRRVGLMNWFKNGWFDDCKPSEITIV